MSERKSLCVYTHSANGQAATAEGGDPSQPKRPARRHRGLEGTSASLKVAEAPETDSPPPDPVIDKGPERYRWRVYLSQLFGKRYAPDKERMKQAQDFAYSKRVMIHAAFDAGRFKADVLAELGVMFEETWGTGKQTRIGMPE